MTVLGSNAARDRGIDVSFVIPVFDAESWIEQCVRSVLGQSGLSVEVICVDDGSTDASNQIIRALASTDSRVVLLEQSNSGQSIARNAGVDAARGRYIAFLDSDDFWHVDAAADLVHLADQEALDVLLFDGHARLEGSVSSAIWDRYATYYQRAGRGYRPSGTGIALLARMRRHGDYRPHVGLYLTRASFLRERGVRFIPGIVHQDNAFTFTLLLGARRARHVPRDVYARRIRPNSTITALAAQRSVAGYLSAYVSMRRELARARPPYRHRRPLVDIVEYTRRGALKRYEELSPESLRAVAESLSSEEARAVLDSFQGSSSQSTRGVRERIAARLRTSERRNASR